MIKGINKNMVVIKNVGSPLFEEAHFILKDSAATSFSRGNIVSEANRIVSKSFVYESLPKRKRGGFKRFAFSFLLFLLGLALGMLLSYLIF